MKILKKIVLSMLLVAGISNVNLNSMIVDGFLKDTNYSQALVIAAGFTIDARGRVHYGPGHQNHGQFVSTVNIQADVPNEQNTVAIADANNEIQQTVISFLNNEFNVFTQELDNLNIQINNLDNTNNLINGIAGLTNHFNRINSLINAQALGQQGTIYAVYIQCNNFIVDAQNRVREILLDRNVISERTELTLQERLSDFYHYHADTNDIVYLASNIHPLDKIKSIVDNINFNRRTKVISVEIMTGGFAVIRLAMSAVGHPVMIIEQIVELLSLAGITVSEIRRN